MQDVTSAFKICLSTLTQFTDSRKRLLFILSAFLPLVLASLFLTRDARVSDQWAEGWSAWKAGEPAAALEHWSGLDPSAYAMVRPSKICYWRIRAMLELGMEKEAEALKLEMARRYPFDYYTFLFFKDGGAFALSDPCALKTKGLFYPRPWRNEVDAASSRTGLRPFVIWSLMRQESKFRVNAVSKTGALGLMQLMPATASAEMVSMKMGEADIISPANNILVGANHFMRLSKKFDGDLPRSLAAYNAGTAPVVRWNTLSAGDWVEWIEEMPYPETKEFVRSVLENMEMYSLLFSEEGHTPLAVMAGQRPLSTERVAFSVR